MILVARGTGTLGTQMVRLLLARGAGVRVLTRDPGELYYLLVVQRGWSLPRYARFLADFMITALLPPAR